MSEKNGRARFGSAASESGLAGSGCFIRHMRRLRLVNSLIESLKVESFTFALPLLINLTHETSESHGSLAIKV